MKGQVFAQIVEKGGEVKDKTLSLDSQCVSLKMEQQDTNNCEYQEAYCLGHIKNKVRILQKELRDWARAEAMLPKIFASIPSTDRPQLAELNK